MGYCIEMTDSRWKIRKENFEAACAALEPMLGDKASMGGGSWSGGRQTGWHYSWIDMDKFAKLVAARDLKGVMEEWRYYCEIDENGDLAMEYFAGEKIGDEDKLWARLAPFVEKDSFIEIRGEDNEMWRWVFDGKTVKEIRPSIVW